MYDDIKDNKVSWIAHDNKKMKVLTQNPEIEKTIYASNDTNIMTNLDWLADGGTHSNLVLLLKSLYSIFSGVSSKNRAFLYESILPKLLQASQ